MSRNIKPFLQHKTATHLMAHTGDRNVEIHCGKTWKRETY